MTRTKPLSIALSIADARKLAAGELREVRVKMRWPAHVSNRCLKFASPLPYVPGDVLAVKEPSHDESCDEFGAPIVVYRAGRTARYIGLMNGRNELCCAVACQFDVERLSFRPGRTMPLWAVRHWLRVTACEPVQEGGCGGGKWAWKKRRLRMDKDGCFSTVVTAAVFAAVGFWVGFSVGAGAVRRTATQHYAAEYRVDPQTGVTTFVWLTDEPQAESENE
jgi:hypothetical protein